MKTRIGLGVVLCLLVGPARAGVCPQAQVNNYQAAMMWRGLADARVVGVYDHPVQLSDGQFIGPPYVAGGHSRPILRLWPELFSTGDLDGQSGEEVAGLLSETSGGSGERVYLLVGRLIDGTAATFPARLVGDRVKVRRIRIEDRRISLDVIEAGDQEPLCCGTTLTRMFWRLEPDGLWLVDNESRGRLSLRVIEDQKWLLVDKGITGPVASSECTTLTFSRGEITGYYQGNPYAGKIVETAPGRIVISHLSGSVGTGQDSTAVREGSFLSLLSSVTGYTFLAGRLTMVGSDAHNPVMLKFAPVRADSP